MSTGGRHARGGGRQQRRARESACARFWDACGRHSADIDPISTCTEEFSADIASRSGYQSVVFRDQSSHADNIRHRLAAIEEPLRVQHQVAITPLPHRRAVLAERHAEISQLTLLDRLKCPAVEQVVIDYQEPFVMSSEAAICREVELNGMCIGIAYEKRCSCQTQCHKLAFHGSDGADVRRYELL